jgi:predicted DNA-binding transcriptional regulator YafY
MESNKGQRLVQMLELMSRAGGVRAAELIERFELDSRSLRRYVADLRDIRVPVVDTGRGDNRVLTVDARWRRTGVQLTLSEVLSLHFGRRLFTFLDGTSFATDLEGAIERLQPAISRTHAELSRQLDRKFVAVPEHAKDYSGEAAEVIDEAVTALLYGHPIDIRYRRFDEVTRRYRLHPYTLAVWRQGLYLLALDVEADQVKTFAVERIAEITRNHRGKFELPAAWNPEGFLQHAFGISSGRPEHVRVAFSPTVRTIVRERRWHDTQSLRRLPDGWMELTMQVAVTAELVSWVLSFGRDARVLGPEALRDQIISHAAGMVSMYSSAPG